MPCTNRIGFWPKAGWAVAVAPEAGAATRSPATTTADAIRRSVDVLFADRITAFLQIPDRQRERSLVPPRTGYQTEAVPRFRTGRNREVRRVRAQEGRVLDEMIFSASSGRVGRSAK